MFETTNMAVHKKMDYC